MLKRVESLCAFHNVINPIFLYIGRIQEYFVIVQFGETKRYDLSPAQLELT